MRRPRRLLLITILAWMPLGSAQDAASPGSVAVEQPVRNPDRFGVLAGSSITCSTAWPSATVGCWWEKRVLTLGDFEVAIAMDAQLALGGTRETYLAPMFSAAWYSATASMWLELAVPDGWLPVPHFGRTDWLRVGFSYQWDP